MGELSLAAQSAEFQCSSNNNCSCASLACWLLAVLLLAGIQATPAAPATPSPGRRLPPPRPTGTANVIVTIPYENKLRNVLPDWDVDSTLVQLIPLEPTHLR